MKFIKRIAHFHKTVNSYNANQLLIFKVEKKLNNTVSIDQSQCLIFLRKSIKAMQTYALKVKGWPGLIFMITVLNPQILGVSNFCVLGHPDLDPSS